MWGVLAIHVRDKKIKNKNDNNNNNNNNNKKKNKIKEEITLNICQPGALVYLYIFIRRCNII